MNQKHFEEIKAREQAATPAPWKIGSESEGRGYYGENVVVGKKDSNFYVVMYRPIYPKETEFNNQVFADMQFAAHARTDMQALIEQHEQDQRQITELRKENQQNAAYAEIYQDICDKYGKNFRALLDKAKSLQTENVTAKKALELAAKHIYWLISNFDYTCHMKESCKHRSCKISCVDCLQQQFAEQAEQLTHVPDEVTHGDGMEKKK